MASVIAWMLLALGVAHMAYGLIKFTVPLGEALSAGLIGQFSTAEARRTAFWFLVFSPMLMLAGHAALHAVATHDLALLRIISGYAVVTSLIGIAAIPKSPFVLALPIALGVLAAGWGWIEEGDTRPSTTSAAQNR